MVTRTQIQALVDQIAARFEPERIILFGSHAAGTATEDSDVDLLVVMDFAGRPIDAALKITCATDPTFPCDILVRSPAEAARLYREHDPFVGHAFDLGEMIYERRLAQVG